MTPRLPLHLELVSHSLPAVMAETSELVADEARPRTPGVPKWLVHSLLAGLYRGLWGILSKLLEKEAHLSLYQI